MHTRLAGAESDRSGLGSAGKGSQGPDGARNALYLDLAVATQVGTYAQSHPPGPTWTSPHPEACMASAVLISIHRKEGNKEGRDRNDPGWCMWAAGRPCKTATDLPDLFPWPTAAHTGGPWVTSAQLLSVGRFEWGAGPLALGRTRPSEEGRKSRVSRWAPGEARDNEGQEDSGGLGQATAVPVPSTWGQPEAGLPVVGFKPGKRHEGV